MSAQGDRPAFPTKAVETWDHQVERWLTSQASQGMTLREHFAGLAMQGLLAANDLTPGGRYYENMAEDAVKFTDALLKALEVKP